MSRPRTHLEAVKRRQDEAAFKVLGLTPAATVLEVDTRWRQLRSELHPDKNPDNPEAAPKFHQAKLAYHAARFYALEPKPCEACGGTGKLGRSKTRGFGQAQLELNCSTCRGSGDQ